MPNVSVYFSCLAQLTLFDTNVVDLPLLIWFCSVPSGRGPAYCGPMHWGLFVPGPGRGGVWLMMCASVCMIEG